MKATALALALLGLTLTASAERAALIEYDDEWNLFSRFELSGTEIDGSSAALGGLTVGGLLNDHVGIGLAGNMLIDTVETESPALRDIEGGDFWYAGGYLEYVFFPQNLVYFSFDVLVGGGQLDVKRESDLDESLSLFITEPGLNLMINITETFMFGLGAGYRFVNGDDLVDLEVKDIEGWNYTAFLRFTQF